MKKSNEMKKNEWLAMIGDIDDKFIDEADPSKLFSTKLKRKKERKRMTPKGRNILAACLSLLIIFSCAVLFIPYGVDPQQDISAYKGSRYYPIIESINSMRLSLNETAKYKNNFEMLSANISKLFSGAFDTTSAMSPPLAGSNNVNVDYVIPGSFKTIAPTYSGNYVEVTDNQVKNVTEADRIKRSDKYIFYLDYNELKIFDINGKNSRQVGSYLIDVPDISYSKFKSCNLEFYISPDCKTVTIISEYAEFVRVLSLDVSDPEDIRLNGSVNVSGSYITSRITNGKLLLITKKNVNFYCVDYEDESTYLPQIDKGEGFESLPAESIDIPQKLSDTVYTVMLMIDTQNMEVSGSHAYMSYSQSPYITSDMIYIYHSLRDEDEFKCQKVESMFTLIYALKYSNDSFERVGEIVLNGQIKDQYSLDEYEGILRVVTTNMSYSRIYYSDNMYYIDRYIQDSVNASLYCIDLESFKVVSSLERFAPDGENVRSARFDGKNAYVCTATLLLDDPIFFFDLSDINNISYKKTDVIPGFSSSLVDFGEGLLLGIGKNENDSLKVEIYKETPDKVIPLCKYEPSSSKNVLFSSEYKSYYVDRENSILGLGVEVYDNKSMKYKTRYLVLYFNGSELTAVINSDLNGECHYQRGVYIDGYFYMFGKNDFKVVKLNFNRS